MLPPPLAYSCTDIAILIGALALAAWPVMSGTTVTWLEGKGTRFAGGGALPGPIGYHTFAYLLPLTIYGVGVFLIVSLSVT